MSMHRRQFLKSSAVAAAGAGSASWLAAQDHKHKPGEQDHKHDNTAQDDVPKLIDPNLPGPSRRSGIWMRRSGNLLKLSLPSFEEEWRLRATGGGFIGSPLLVDLDRDGRDDVVASAMNGALYRLDADDGSVAWQRRIRPAWKSCNALAPEPFR